MSPSPKSNPNKQNRRFLVRTTDKVFLGPCSLDVLKKWVRERKVRAIDEVCETGGHWTPIKYSRPLLEVLGEMTTHPAGETTVDLTQEITAEKPRPRWKIIRRAEIEERESEKAVREKVERFTKAPRVFFTPGRRLLLIFGIILIAIVGTVLLIRRPSPPPPLTREPSPAEVKVLPEAFQTAYQLGRTYEDAALFEKAREQYDRALKMVPNNIAVQIRLTAIAIQEKRAFKHAEELLSQLNIREGVTIPQKAIIANYRSVAALGLKDDSQGESHARQSINLDDKFAPAYFNLGKSLYLQKKYFDAKSTIEKSLELQPNQTLPYIYLGKTLSLMKRVDDALAEFRNATEVNSRDLLPHLHVVSALASLNRSGEAVAELERTAKLDPDYEQNTLRDERYSTEENEFSELLRKIVNQLKGASLTTTARAELALLEFLYGDKEKGVVTLEQLVSLDPQNAVAHSFLGYVYQRQGKIKEAIEQLRIALRYDYQSEFAQTLLGDLLLGTGEGGEALSHYHKVLSQNAFNLSAHQGVAVYYFEQKEFDQAKRAEEQILQIDPTYLPARRGLLSIQGARE